MAYANWYTDVIFVNQGRWEVPPPGMTQSLYMELMQRVDNLRGELRFDCDILDLLFGPCLATERITHLLRIASYQTNAKPHEVDAVSLAITDALKSLLKKNVA